MRCGHPTNLVTTGSIKFVTRSDYVHKIFHHKIGIIFVLLRTMTIEIADFLVIRQAIALRAGSLDRNRRCNCADLFGQSSQMARSGPLHPARRMTELIFS
jgi:hypothetical protein